ncbi:sulfotransferase family protein [Nitzschia inconspicua]|uniref:Sulfotransferase family protein n=1 Tax=Nitzschia inconspicua TaxID=303405 RepID=A0A9K3PFU6_9STRA|nr:sulfotransferase family protein [Nitzschia inconspicua]
MDHAGESNNGPPPSFLSAINGKHHASPKAHAAVATPSRKKRRHEVASRHIAFLLVLSMFVGTTHLSTTISSLNVFHSQYQYQDDQNDSVGGGVESSSSSTSSKPSSSKSVSFHSLVSATFRTISKLLGSKKPVAKHTSVNTIHNDEHKQQQMQRQQMQPWNLRSNNSLINATSDTSPWITDPNTYHPRPRSGYSWSQEQQLQQDDSFNETTVPTTTTTTTARLAFLHIPKTGGSSIEHAGAKGGQTWGICLFTTMGFCRHKTNRQIVGSLANRSSQSLPAFDLAWKNTIQDSPFSREYFGGRSFPMWHLPIQYLPSHPANAYYDANLTDPYHSHRQDVFAVVRNPYKRIVSEYYYACHIAKCFLDHTTNNDTAARMNHVIQQTLTRNHQFIKSGTSGWIRTDSVNKTRSMGHNQQPHKKYFIASGHWIPQYDYIYSYSPSSVSNNTTTFDDDDDINTLVEQQVKHILHFEHLTEEFASLMDAYKLPVNLTTVDQQLSRSDWNTRQTVANLDSQTRRLIEDVYELDFDLGGGYIMIERTKLARNDPTNRHVCNYGQLLYVVGSKLMCL